MVEATVMIAAWNAADTIERSVASSLAQSGITTEVIVVDDVSRDETAVRAGAAGARILATPFNGGPAAARNRAIEAAEGDWIAVLDADDTMVPDRLRRMADLGTAMQADVVLGNFRKVDESGAPMEPEPFLVGPEYDAPQAWGLERFVAGNQVAPGSRPLGYLKPLFRRNFLEKNGLRYDVRLRNGEDCHLIFACLAAGAKVVYSPPADYLYTVRRGSISHRADPAHIEALIAADDDFLARHADALSPREQALFASRRRALAELKDSEEVLQALKALRPVTALAALARRPSAAGRVLEQLLEAGRKRARDRRPAL